MAGDTETHTDLSVLNSAAPDAAGKLLNLLVQMLGASLTSLDTNP